MFNSIVFIIYNLVFTIFEKGGMNICLILNCIMRVPPCLQRPSRASGNVLRDQFCKGDIVCWLSASP